MLAITLVAVAILLYRDDHRQPCLHSKGLVIESSCYILCVIITKLRTYTNAYTL